MGPGTLWPFWGSRTIERSNFNVQYNFSTMALKGSVKLTSQFNYTYLLILFAYKELMRKPTFSTFDNLCDFLITNRSHILMLQAAQQLQHNNSSNNNNNNNLRQRRVSVVVQQRRSQHCNTYYKKIQWRHLRCSCCICCTSVIVADPSWKLIAGS